MFVRPPALALIFALTGTLLLAGPAKATLWQPVQTTAKSQTEVDIDTISKKDGTATAWVQQVHADPTGSKTGAYFVFRTMKTQVRYQCAQRSATVLTRGYFNDAGTELALERKPEETRPVQPDSTEDRALTVACAADPKKAAAALRKSEPAQSRYMDSPVAASEQRPGVVKVNAPAEAPHDAPARPAAPDAHAAPAAPAAKAHADAAPAAHAAVHKAATPARPDSHGNETRDKVVARVLRARTGQPAAAEPAHEEAHWSYEGENAPYRWGDMKSDFATCKSGSRQSPIDIRNPVMAEMDPIVFHYEESPLKVLNNGHTIQVEIAPGSFILYGGARYELLQMHFHTPSEERVNGRSFEMVAHLVHKSAQGKLAVVAVLLSAGQPHAVIETIWNTMPGTAGRTRERADVQFNPMTLLPAERGYYSFQGSLTTPPCTEGVQWLVLKTPVELGREQVAHFSALYPMNARPLQPANDRVVKAGR